MKIKFLADFGPTPEGKVYRAGTATTDFDDASAVRLIQAGYAEAVVEAVRETAVQAAPSRRDIEGVLTELGVPFVQNADLDSLAALLKASRPAARDGDGDGKVLDGTPAERPKRKAG